MPPPPASARPDATSVAGTSPSPASSGSTPLTAPTPRLGAEAPAGPPQLSGSRLGPPPPGDPAAAAFKARYQPEPIPYVEKKRSKALVSGLVAGALLLVGGGVFAAVKLLPAYDDFVANPMGTPSVRASDEPADGNEPVAAPTPDVVVAKENKLYRTGKLAPANCREPQYRPTSKENVRAYYQTLLGCLDKAWEPAVRKAGHEFRKPRLIIFDNGQETACGVQHEVPSYCAADGGAVTLPWEGLPEKYGKDRSQTRIDMAQELGYLYGVHVQELTGIFEATENLGDTAPNAAARLEQDRRQALQAVCLSSVFLSTVKATFPIRGELLESYRWRSKHNGDEDSKDKVRDHGSRRNVELWMGRGFGSADPGSCNTFVAAPAKVS
ncbi:neutral zinc metallopeptidase [Kribbella flavida]|uniref:neutral zinc metallopeptidase n=1 Tax=Kribbella flavida TaxID=182640 RepID=UPI001ED93320|nr:neutral zinc metallopeptidase [Kribbella flavida]